MFLNRKKKKIIHRTLSGSVLGSSMYPNLSNGPGFQLYSECFCMCLLPLWLALSDMLCWEYISYSLIFMGIYIFSSELLPTWNALNPPQLKWYLLFLEVFFTYSNWEPLISTSHMFSSSLCLQGTEEKNILESWLYRYFFPPLAGGFLCKWFQN